jgi:hypothetical protein
MGQEPEKAVRGCLLATELARALDLRDADVHDVHWTTLLQHVGCTAPAHEAARLFGDDLTVGMQVERTDPTSLRETWPCWPPPGAVPAPAGPATWLGRPPRAGPGPGPSPGPCARSAP